MNYKDKLETLKEWEDTKEHLDRVDNIIDEAINEVSGLTGADNRELREAPYKDYLKLCNGSKIPYLAANDNSINNGGKTDYYQLKNAPFPINDFDDFAEWRGLNGNQFNMGKVMWTFNVGRHKGTDYERDLNKIIHYANRELLRLSRDK